MQRSQKKLRGFNMVVGAVIGRQFSNANSRYEELITDPLSLHVGQPRLSALQR